MSNAFAPSALRRLLLDESFVRSALQAFFYDQRLLWEDGYDFPNEQRMKEYDEQRARSLDRASERAREILTDAGEALPAELPSAIEQLATSLVGRVETLREVRWYQAAPADIEEAIRGSVLAPTWPAAVEDWIAHPSEK